MLDDCDNRLASRGSLRKRRTTLYRKQRPGSSAIMRRPTPLGAFGGVAMTAMAFLIVAAPRALGAEVGTAVAGPDSTWLPAPEEDLETLEPLEEEHAVVHAGALLRGSVAGGRFRMRRVGLQGRRLGLAAEAGILLDGARVRPGARLVAERGRVSIAGGRVSLARGR